MRDTVVSSLQVDLFYALRLVLEPFEMLTQVIVASNTVDAGGSGEQGYEGLTTYLWVLLQSVDLDGDDVGSSWQLGDTGCKELDNFLLNVDLVEGNHSIITSQQYLPCRIVMCWIVEGHTLNAEPTDTRQRPDLVVFEVQVAVVYLFLCHNRTDYTVNTSGV